MKITPGNNVKFVFITQKSNEKNSKTSNWSLSFLPRDHYV